MSDYEIGYGKPPTHSRWKKGQSGNPKGRKRKVRSDFEVLAERMKALMLQEAYRPVEVEERGKKVKMPLIQAVIRRQGVTAAQGGLRATRYFMESLRSIEEENWKTYASYVKQMIDYKIDVGREFERRRKLDPSEPEPVPHPDDIIIHDRTGIVEVRGPMTKEDEVWWDRIEDTEAQIADLEEMLAADPKNKFLKKDLADERKLREILARAVPNYKPRPSRRKLT